MSQYWIIAVPYSDAEQPDTVRKELEKATAQRDLSTNFRFKLPKMKVGTIDTLISLSDDLEKLSGTLGNLTKKIKRTFDDAVANEPSKLSNVDRQVLSESLINTMLEGNSRVPTTLTVSGPSGGNSESLPAKTAFEKFIWDRYGYNENDSIEKLRLYIVDKFSQSDDKLRRSMMEYSEVRSALTTEERKENGTLLVRPISKFVTPDAVFETKYLVSIVLAVPRVKEQEFLDTYESVEQKYIERKASEKKKQEEIESKDVKEGALRPNSPMSDDDVFIPLAEEPVDSTPQTKSSKIQTCTVVAGSALKIVSETDVPDDEFVLYRVVLFKRYEGSEENSSDSERSAPNVERFKSICRDHRWTIRPFTYDANEESRNKLKMAKLLNLRREKWEDLVRWCESEFDDVCKAWMHVLAMRTYVEAVLRYGLKKKWMAVLVSPKRNTEKKLRDALGKLYNQYGDAAFCSGNGVVEDATTGEYYPYVYIPVDFSDL